MNAWFNKARARPDLLERENYRGHLADVIVLFAWRVQARLRTLVLLQLLMRCDQNCWRFSTPFTIRSTALLRYGPIRQIRNTNEESVRVLHLGSQAIVTRQQPRKTFDPR